MASIPIYLQVITGVMQEGLTPDRAAHQRIHDHLAGVMDSAVKECHGNESAGFKALVEADMTESGRMIARKHAVTIAAAHDEAARACGMSCEGCYKEALGMAPSDTDHDGDNLAVGNDLDANGESHKGETILTEEEMLAALKAKGYTVEVPKTAEQKLEEQAVKLASLEAKLAQLTEAAPQRQTLAAPSQLIEEGGLKPEELYEEGDHLKGDLKPQNWRSLANRRVPWPQGIDPAQALHELAPFMTARLLEQEANAQGRSINDVIAPYERV